MILRQRGNFGGRRRRAVELGLGILMRDFYSVVSTVSTELAKVERLIQGF